MAMVCPQCSSIYENQERRCNQCNVQLLFYARFGSPSAVPQAERNEWQQNPWGKIIAGVILAQGLALGIRHLVTAAYVASGDPAFANLWQTLPGLGLLHLIHAVGLLAGGMLAGASQHRGLLFGSLVGLSSGFVFLFYERQASELLAEGAVYTQPFLHMLIGAIGGLLGKFIWKPTPLLALPEGKDSGVPLPPALEMRWLQGPIYWWRIAVGATLVVCGVVWSQLLMKWLVDYSQGLLTVTTHFQARIITWEISGMMILLGAMFAGATTYNGSKQGLCVGLGASVMFVGFQLANPNAQLEMTVFSIVSMIGLALVGGWFGSQLFPPLGIPRRRRRIADA